MTACLNGSHTITSNSESGAGRYDIALMPIDKKRPGVIMELKTASSLEQLAQRAEEACQQVMEKNYGQRLTQQGVSSLFYLGVAFHKKQLAAAYCSPERKAIEPVG